MTMPLICVTVATYTAAMIRGPTIVKAFNDSTNPLKYIDQQTPKGNSINHLVTLITIIISACRHFNDIIVHNN